MPTFKCPQCGGDFQADSEGKYHCPHCDNTIALHLHVHGKIPWETWREVGRLRAFWETWKQAMSNPVAFFRRVPKQGNFVLPMYYGIICQSLAIILMWAYQAGFHAIPTLMNMTADFGGYGPWTMDMSWPSMMILVTALVVIAPVFAVAGLFCTSAIYHVCLMVLGGARHGFEGTFRAVCYGSSAQGLSVIPMIGSVVAGVWSLVLTVIGIKEIHQTNYVRAILAVVLPVVICCGFIILVVAALFGAAIGAWMGGGA
jgi:hypothetical protein